jgi:hypothetical protein
MQVKESLPALVRDLFTFSSKVIKKFHSSMREHLNVQKKRKQSKKAKIRAPTG